MSLALFKKDQFLGVLGERTGCYIVEYLNGGNVTFPVQRLEICVGDVIKVTELISQNQVEGIVYIHNGFPVVGGMDRTPLTTLHIYHLSAPFENIESGKRNIKKLCNGRFDVKESNLTVEESEQIHYKERGGL